MGCGGGKGDDSMGQAVMAQILRFPKHRWPQGRAETLSRIINAVSGQRHPQEDVYWLKENAELLNVLECTTRSPDVANCSPADRQGSGSGGRGGGSARRPELAGISDDALMQLRAFYRSADRYLCFFRQYYRFVLSICLDLEDLGLVDLSRDGTGTLGQALGQWVVQQDLPGQELSDLQRAEARRLLARRGITRAFPGLDARLHGFIDNSAQFAVPNRKAAYELTHIVFYLSDYGRHDPALSAAAVQSLTYVGLLALLDQDADLLSEVCIALRYCGETPPAIWEGWLRQHHLQFVLTEASDSAAPELHQDAYHMFLVSSWHQGLCGGTSFTGRVPTGALRIQAPAPQGVLHRLSQSVFQADPQAGAQRVGWHSQRPQIYAGLSESEAEVLSAAERSASDFEAFFEAFSRSGSIGRPAARVQNG